LRWTLARWLEADCGKSRNCGGSALKYLKNFVAERPFCA
jgi:hypothetical protein